MKRGIRRTKRLSTTGACLGLAFTGSIALQAQPAAGSADDKITELEKQNRSLQQRLDTLEMMAKKEGWLATPPPKPSVSALSPITLSGFVTASYFHDSNNPGKHISPGYLWSRYSDSFALNKVKLTLASPPAERSGDKFDVAYRVSLIAGQDAQFVNTGSLYPGAKAVGFDYLREAYIELNVPIGTGLNVKAGELISLLNYESGDGGAANNNFSQGYQWFFTGNPPAAGIELGYAFTDWLDLKVRVQNGLYAGPIDNNSSKTYVASLGIKPMNKLWFNLIGFGGREDAGFTQSLWGGSLLGGWQPTEQLGFGTELDYFNFYNPPGVVPAGHSPVWSTGLWTSYDFTKKVGLALRAEFLSDKDGVDASGGALGFMNPPGTGQDLSSLAVTLNYKPMASVKIQPEVRFDHTSWSGGFVSGKQDRVIFGAGISYLY